MKFARKYNFDFTKFENIDNQDKAYWLGFIMADGSINKRNTELRIELSNKDIDHLEKFKYFMDYDGPIRETRKNCSIISLNSIEFISWFNQWGIITNKTYLDIKIPNIDRVLVPHFIRGFWDGDGWVSYRTSKLQNTQYIFGFSSYCSDFLQEIKDNISPLLGPKCGKIIERKRGDQRVCQWTIEGNNNFIPTYNYLYKGANYYLERKYQLSYTYYNSIISNRTIKCLNCNNEHYSAGKQGKFCSRRCADQYSYYSNKISA